MRERILNDLKTAMKNQDEDTLKVIRMVKGSIELREISLKRNLNDEEVIGVILKEIMVRRDSIEKFERANRQDLVDETNNEIQILETYLPEQLSKEEVLKIIDIFSIIPPREEIPHIGNTCVVYYSGWELECCGTPFSVGDVIEWTVTKKFQSDMENIDYFYDGHDQVSLKDKVVLKGIVDKIQIEFVNFKHSEDGSNVLLPDERCIVYSETAEGFEKHNAMELYGYIVTIRDFVTKPADKRYVSGS